MNERDRDLPWNDIPADSDVVPGTEEPDPAEVEGDEGDEVDVSHGRIPDVSDKYRRESLDQRLSEEVPDRIVDRDDFDGGGIEAAESGDDDISLDRGEPDENDDDSDSDDESAEEAAIHLDPRS